MEFTEGHYPNLHLHGYGPDLGCLNYRRRNSVLVTVILNRLILVPTKETNLGHLRHLHSNIMTNRSHADKKGMEVCKLRN